MSNNQMTCDPERIERFLQQHLSDVEQTEFELHLDDCENCRHQLETTAARDDVWAGVRDSLSGDDFAPAKARGVENADEVRSDSNGRFSYSAVLDLLAPTDDERMLGRLGTYEVVGVIGSGGMGVVLKAFDPALNRYVAIKVLAPHLGGSGAARKRFSREAQAAAAVVHDNVIEIHGVADVQELPYLVMSYVRGPSLQKRLDDEGSLALVEILRIGMQAATGLAAAHAQGLVHRDVKPANILLADGVERVKLTDFGLARASDDASLTKSGVIAGTPQYMSPEQARGETIDQRSDLFSLGSVLYAMCTGRAPFRAETSYGVLRRITDEEPTPIREINPDIPDWFCRIVARLMAKRPADRFASAADVAALLEQCLAHVQQPTVVRLPETFTEETQPSPASSPGPRTFARRFSKAIIRGVVMAMFALVLAGFMLWAPAGPPDISGLWVGTDWGMVQLQETTPGEYTGTYTDTFGNEAGTLELMWSGKEQRFKGTWREGEDRFGKIAIRLVDGEIRGAWTTDDDARIQSGTPELADLLWVRYADGDGSAPPNVRGTVSAILSIDQMVLISIGANDGLKLGNRLFVCDGPEYHGQIDIVHLQPDTSVARIVSQIAGTKIRKGDRVVTRIDSPANAAEVAPVPPTHVVPSSDSPNAAPRTNSSIEFRLASAEAAEGYVAMPVEGGDPDELIYVSTTPIATNKDILAARAVRDANDRWSVEVTFTDEFAVQMLQLTEEHMGELLAIVVRGKVISAPALRERISNKALITGNFSRDNAEQIANSLHDMPYRVRQFAVDSKVLHIACSADGTKIAVANGNPTRVLQQSGTSRVQGNWQPMVSVLDADSGEVIASLTLATEEENAVIAATPRVSHFEVTALAFSPDGSLLAVGTSIGQLKLYNTATGELTLSVDDAEGKAADEATPDDWKQLARALGSISSLAFSPDGKYLATCGDSFADYAKVFDDFERLSERTTAPGRLKVWEVSTGTLVRDLIGHSHANAVAYSPDGKLLASAGRWMGPNRSGNGDGVILWNTSTGEKLSSFSHESNGGTIALAISPDSRLIAMSSVNFDKDKVGSTGIVTLLRAGTGIVEWRRSFPVWAQPLGFSPDGKLVAALTGGKTLSFLNADTGEISHEFPASDASDGGRWTSMAVSPTHKLLAIGGVDGQGKGSVEVWSFGAAGGE